MAVIVAAVSVVRVTRFALQPRWLAWHLLLVAVLVSFTWLGGWQLSAFEGKDGAPPAARATVPLERLSAPGGRLEPADLGRRVRVEGRYDPDHTVLVPGRTEPGGSREGFLVVSPLLTSAGVLPVLRGWVETPGSPAVAPPAGTVRAVGLLQRSETGPPPGAMGAVGEGRLPYVATVTLLDALPYQPAELYDGFLALRSEAPDPAAAPVPVEAQAAVTDGVGRWRNLGYALQWWLFAAAAVFFWWTVLRRAALEQREHDPAPDEGPPPLLAPRRTT
jgi:cytochrome oxidase assembly protein ShyY1